MVGLEGVAGGDEVDDGIGQTHQRSKLHRAVQLDQINVDALARKVLTSCTHILGGDAKAGALRHGSLVVEAFAYGDAHAATRNIEIDGLVKPTAVTGGVLEEYVFACNTEVGGAILHISGHIRRTHDDQLQPRVAGGKNEFARGFGIFADLYAGSRQQGQGFVKNAPLGEGQGQWFVQGSRAHWASVMRTMSAPT